MLSSWKINLIKGETLILTKIFFFCDFKIKYKILQKHTFSNWESNFWQTNHTIPWFKATSEYLEILQTCTLHFYSTRNTISENRCKEYIIIYVCRIRYFVCRLTVYSDSYSENISSRSQTLPVQRLMQFSFFIVYLNTLCVKLIRRCAMGLFITVYYFTAYIIYSYLCKIIILNSKLKYPVALYLF